MLSINYVTCFKEVLVNFTPTKNIDIEKKVAIFLYAISNHLKNRVLKREFARSVEIVNRQFGVVLQSILKLHGVLLKKP